MSAAGACQPSSTPMPMCSRYVPRELDSTTFFLKIKIKKKRSVPKTSRILPNRFRLGSSVIQKTLCCQQASNIYNSPWLGELTRLEDSVRRHVTSNRGSSLERSLNLNTVKEWILLMPTVHHMLSNCTRYPVSGSSLASKL